jgi:hypothetical protein
VTSPILTFWISSPYSDYFITYVCKYTTFSGIEKVLKKKVVFARLVEWESGVGEKKTPSLGGE